MIATLIAAAAVAASPAPTNSPIIQAVMKAAHTGATAQQADKFAATPAIPGAEGAPFKVFLHLRDGDSTGTGGTSGFWTFKDGKLEFVVTLDRAPVSVLAKDAPQVLFFGGAMTAGKSYVGSNAYGASVRVSVENWKRNALAAMSIPEGEPLPFMIDYAAQTHMDPKTLARDTFPYVLQVSGPEARKLVANVRVVVEGTLTPLASGKLTECAQHYNGPQIDAPSEVNQENCWVGANITRVAYINVVTGEVLKEFTAPTVSPRGS